VGNAAHMPAVAVVESPAVAVAMEPPTGMAVESLAAPLGHEHASDDISELSAFLQDGSAAAAVTQTACLQTDMITAAPLQNANASVQVDALNDVPAVLQEALADMHPSDLPAGDETGFEDRQDIRSAEPPVLAILSLLSTQPTWSLSQTRKLLRLMMPCLLMRT
jgi:hypothetical protein